MLVLSRKKDQSILIGDDIELVIVDIGDDKVKIGIRAPKTMKVFRKELLQEVEQENKNSTVSEKVDISKLAITLNKNKEF